MRTKGGFADVNGTRLFYTVNGNGKAIAFIHGLTLDHRMWEGQIETLAEQFRVITYDVRGFGQSDPPIEMHPYRHADDLYELLKMLGESEAIIVGLSMGGRIAIEFALIYPEATWTLVLVDAPLDGHPFSPEYQGTLNALYDRWQNGKIDEAKQKWIDNPLFAYSLKKPHVAVRLAEIVGDCSAWQMTHDDPHVPMVPPAIDQLSSISVPTLVVTGAHDLPDFQLIAEILSERIPNAHRVTLPDAGHMANMDAPEAFNRVVLDFLALI